MKMRLPFRPSQDAHIDTELLSAYLDGHSKPDERRRVETHLGTCPACQSELESLRQTVTMLHALPRVPVPRAFTLSEAQVGLRQASPAGRPTWFGGMARGLAAVGAVALVAVMAAALLRQPSWQPAQNVAQVADPAPAAELALARVEPTHTAVAPQAAPAGAPAAPAIALAPKALVAPKAPAPTAAPLAAEQPVTKPAAKPTEKASVAAVIETAPPAAKTQPDQPAAAIAAAPVTPLATDRPTIAPAALAAAAAPTSTLALARDAQEADVMAAAAGKSSATPAAAPTPVQIAFPVDAIVIYADTRGLWALDRAGSARPLVQAAGVTAPIISDDHAWIAYRQSKDNSAEVWVAPWSDGAARLLLAERDLNAGLPEGYRARRIQDVRWLPGTRMLLVTVLLTPASQDAPAPLELWTVNAESGERKLLTSGDAHTRPAIAPNGGQIAFFKRESAKPGEGSLWLIGADGGGERAALRFPVQPDARSFDGQLAWLPDSSTVWAAIPAAPPSNGLSLYRVPLTGEAQSAGRVDGNVTFWAPNGTRLAYTRLSGDATGPRELYLADADGANPQRYATIANGRFSGWSPDSARFLYEDGGQLFVGAPATKAQGLAAGALDARWFGPNQVVYQLDQGNTRSLISQAVDGKPTTLQTLAVGATYDISQP